MPRITKKNLTSLLEHDYAGEELNKLVNYWYATFTRYSYCTEKLACKILEDFSKVVNMFELITLLHPSDEQCFNNCQNPEKPYHVFINSGDTYSASIYWSSKTGRFLYGSWGDIAEKYL